jgi:hypothetical protein
VRLGDGAGGFGAAQEYVYGWGYPTSIAAADFNNDSKLDIVVTDLSGCSILLGNGNGTFQSALEPASGTECTSPWGTSTVTATSISWSAGTIGISGFTTNRTWATVREVRGPGGLSDRR